MVSFNLKYVSKNATSEWLHYRRRVPSFARGLIDRSEIVFSLRTRDLIEAHRRTEIMNARVEALFVSLLRQSAPPALVFSNFQRGLKILEISNFRDVSEKRGGKEQSDVGVGLPDSSIVNLEQASTDERNEMLLKTKPRFGAVPNKAPSCNLEEALKLYLDEKGAKDEKNGAAWKRFNQERCRVIRNLTSLIGNKDIDEISRKDARKFRDHLIELGKSTNTVNKYIANCHAILALAYREYELQRSNPFSGLKLSDGVAPSDKRKSFDLKELSQIIKLIDSGVTSNELRDIFLMLTDTGARLSEIAGLRKDDVVLNAGKVPYIRIRSNDIRTLKNHSSKREVPLIGIALKGAISAVARRYSKPENVPLFPGYGDDKGNTRASAALMKFLRGRAKVADKQLCVHSLRHTMKDRLRNAGVPKDVRDAIQGHAAANVGDHYGNGFEKCYLHSMLQKIEKDL